MYQCIKLPSGKFETSAYRKATNADIVLHYDSNSPASHKRCCATALFSRSTTHCSSVEARKQERNYLHRLFGDNSYSFNFIKRALRHRNRKHPPIPNGETAPSTWRALPYNKHVSELIARHLRPFNFVIAHKPTQSLRGT